jgi:hypothetical protein
MQISRGIVRHWWPGRVVSANPTRSTDMITRTTIAAALAVTLLATAARPADACGPYSAESAVEYMAWKIFVRGRTAAEIDRRFAELDRESRANMRLADDEWATTRWHQVDGKWARAIVAIRRGEETLRHFEITYAMGASKFDWRPTSVAPASRHAVRVVELADQVRDLKRRLASAKLSKR